MTLASSTRYPTDAEPRPPADRPRAKTSDGLVHQKTLSFRGKVGLTALKLAQTSASIVLYLSVSMSARSLLPWILGGAFLAIFEMAGWFNLIVALSMERVHPIDSAVPQDLRIAMMTTVVPSREPLALLERKLEAMRDVRIAHDNWVLDEEGNDEVRALAEKYGARYFSRAGRPEYQETTKGRGYSRFQSRQKGGNLNAALDHVYRLPVAYDIITFMDLDAIPVPEYYELVLPYFNEPGIGFVQGADDYWNSERNFLTRGATHVRRWKFGMEMRGAMGVGVPHVIGTHTTFRVSALKEIGGYYPVHLTEDHLMGMTLRSRSVRGAYFDGHLIENEHPMDWPAYRLQQMRWALGTFDVNIRYLPRLARTLSFREILFYVGHCLYYFSGGLQALGKLLLVPVLLAASGRPSALAMTAAVYLLLSPFLFFLLQRRHYQHPYRRHHFVASLAIENFLSFYRLLAFVQALWRPNRPYVTTPKGEHHSGRNGRFQPALRPHIVHLALDGLLVVLLGMSKAWLWSPFAPLILTSLVMNAYIFLFQGGLRTRPGLDLSR